MKKIVTFIISFILIMSFGITAFASNNAIVFANDVTLANEETLIPVEIKNNSGIMGFRITINYDSTKVDICSVTKGEICSKGNFITDFGTSDNAFDVVWNNTDNVSADGNLFILSAKPKDNAKGSSIIKISYSQPDTFNVLYEDVVLNCKNINIAFSNQDEITTNTSSIESNIKDDNKNSLIADDEQLIQAINITLRQEGISSLNNVKDKILFIKKLTENLNTITGSTDNNIVDFDSINDIYNNSYSNEFIKEVTNNIDSDKINTIVSDTLKDFGVNSVDDLNNKDMKEFISSVEEKLKAEDSDIPNISSDLDVNKALQIIDKIYNDSSNKTKKHNNTILIIISCLVIISILGLSLLIIIKKHKK